MTIILFIILETGWETGEKTAWELEGYWELEITSYMCVHVCVFTCKSSAFMYICKSAYPAPPCTLIATSVHVVFNIAEHETMGYKLAFQPDIFDMISASHLVSLLFVSFLP